MTGTFELFTDEDTRFRFRLTAPDGTVMALSRPFPDKAAVAGITVVREYAGMGLITDLCPDVTLHQPSATARPARRTTSPLATAPPPPAARSAGALPPWTATGTPAKPGHGTLDRDTRRHKAA